MPVIYNKIAKKMKLHRITESQLRRLIEQEVTKYTRYGRDYEEYGSDDMLHPEDIIEFVQPVVDVLNKLKDVYDDLLKKVDTLDDNIDAKCNELGLEDITHDFLKDIDDLRSYADDGANTVQYYIDTLTASYREDNGVVSKPDSI